MEDRFMRYIAITMLGIGATLSSSKVLAKDGFQLIWKSGFEKGYPGEWNRYDNGSWSADGSGREVHQLQVAR